MPTYNSEKYIIETINSVRSQTYKSWELVIVDDCSTDKTVKIIKNIIDNDSRIKLIKLDKNKGVSQARNLALDNVTGRFISYLDSDDIWKENKLSRQIEFMKNKGYAFCIFHKIPSPVKTNIRNPQIATKIYLPLYFP